MRHRELLAIRKFRDEENAREEAARETRERPIREAENQLRQTSIELGKITRQNLLTTKDSEFKVDSAVAYPFSLSREAAIAFNEDQGALFVQQTPDFYPCHENQATIEGFLARNGVQVANTETYRLAFERLRDYGLLTEWPIEPQPEPEPTQPPQQEPSEPEYHGYEVGIDLDTGEERYYTPMQINAMTADIYRKVFRLPKVNRPGEQQI